MEKNPWDALKEQKVPIDLSKVDWAKPIVEPKPGEGKNGG